MPERLPPTEAAGGALEARGADAGAFPTVACSPVARRERRRAVEQALLQGLGTLPAMRLLAERFGVSRRTLRQDVRRIERAWAAEDGAALARRRSAVVRRLSENAEACRNAGDLGAEQRALVALGKMLGLGVAQVAVGVNVAPRLIQAEELRRLLGTPTGTDDVIESLRRLAAPAPEPVRRLAP